MSDRAENLNSELLKEIQELKAELVELRQQIQQDTASEAEEKKEMETTLLKTVEQAIINSFEKVKQPLDKAGEAAQSAAEFGRNAVEKAEERPILSMLAAFGLGMIIAKLFGRH